MHSTLLSCHTPCGHPFWDGFSFLLCVFKKQNVIVKQGIMQLLLKQDGLQVLTAHFPFLKNPSPKPSLPKSGGGGQLMALEGGAFQGRR